MKVPLNKIFLFLIFISFVTSCKQEPQKKIKPKTEVENIQKDPLASWNDTSTKKEILAYIDAVTDKNNSRFIPVADRIAVFDNDGNLWSEQPAYFQLFFAMDRVKSMAKNHPGWKNKQPFKAVLEDDMETLAKQGEEGLIKLVLATHSGNSTEEFDADVKNWIATAKHPTKNVTYDKLVYQPMLELLQYLRANDFKTYVVSGGGVDFMRAFIPEIYGIPKEQILGSRVKTKYEYNNGDPKIIRLPKIEFIDDKDGKPLNIQKIIGKKPVFSSGNSDGDLAMMQWTASNKYKSFMLYLHHTDAEREWAYDRKSHIGKLDKGLDQAKKHGWTVIDMKKDWKMIFPYELH